MLPKKEKIKIYADGPNKEDIGLLEEKGVDGYTFNPSLFRKNNAIDYIEYSKEILELIPTKPVSLEVISDTNDEMIKQAIVLHDLNPNVYVKIPITNTNGISTLPVLEKLIDLNIKMNVTAIFTIKQVSDILNSIKDSETIISVFSGRIFDIGLNAVTITKEISDLVHNNSQCKVLWASTRMSYDINNAINSNCDIITMSKQFIDKLSIFHKSPEEYSLETVKMFYKDAVDAKYNF